MNAYTSKLLGSLRPYRKWQIASVITAMAASMWLGARIGASRSRYSVTGKIDPASGYRIEYTVASDFHKSVDKDPIAQSRHELEAWAYDPPPLSASSNWIGEHIFGTNQSTSQIKSVGHAIRQATIRGVSPRGTLVDSQGYVELADIAEIGIPIFEQRLTVSGCPASWYGIETEPTPRSEEVLYLFCLFIRPKDCPIIYGFVGMALSDSSAEEVKREMISIRDSIRIQKLK